jgi:hypothetical protein
MNVIIEELRESDHVRVEPLLGQQNAKPRVHRLCVGPKESSIRRLSHAHILPEQASANAGSLSACRWN